MGRVTSFRDLNIVVNIARKYYHNGQRESLKEQPKVDGRDHQGFFGKS